MKQCPLCKARYTDDSLSFCLNDGAALFALPDEQLTQARSPAAAAVGSGNQMRGNFEPPGGVPKTEPFALNLPPASTAARSNNGKTAFIVAGLGLLLLLFVGGIVAALVLIPRGETGKTETSLKSPSPPPVSPAKNDSDELKQKIADLERRLEEQKKSAQTPLTTNNNSTPAASSSVTQSQRQQPSLNQSGKAVARVAQSNDGFLSLRTEPSVRSGAQLVKIPSGSVVELEDCQTGYQTIDGRRGRWCMISYNGRTGWAFDGWLIY
jgi:hypothetical protein